MTLECFSIGEMAPALLREVEDFLDSQDTGHPFQYPHWAGSRARVMLIREHGKICWLGTFVVQGPLGRRFPWIRALVANRGPVCDDSHFWQNAAEKLADMLREEKFTYLDVLPEWLCQADHDHPTFANHSKWRCVGKDRASLRLDLKQSEDDIFANFRKISHYEVRRANDWEPPPLRPQVRPRSKSFCPSISAWRSARVSHLIPSTTYVATFIG